MYTLSDKQCLLDIFIELSQLRMDLAANDESTTVATTSKTSNQSQSIDGDLKAECRRLCAYNMPVS